MIQTCENTIPFNLLDLHKCYQKSIGPKFRKQYSNSQLLIRPEAHNQFFKFHPENYRDAQFPVMTSWRGCRSKQASQCNTNSQSSQNEQPHDSTQWRHSSTSSSNPVQWRQHMKAQSQPHHKNGHHTKYAMISIWHQNANPNKSRGRHESHINPIRVLTSANNIYTSQIPT